MKFLVILLVFIALMSIKHDIIRIFLAYIRFGKTNKD